MPDTLSQTGVEKDLEELVSALANHPAVREKACIQKAYAPAEEVSGDIALGDDCAAIPDPVGGGHLLFAAEGMLDGFVADDPWFAGYSAVMVNLSDIASMGGRPLAITNTLWAPEGEVRELIWQGMRSASQRYGVPIVGGHTTELSSDSAARLGASALGRAGQHLLTSFHAQAGDRLLLAIDMRGAYRGDKPFWNASTTASPKQLREGLEILPTIAEKQLSRAAKDVSNGGIVGTLAMLCSCSGVGARLDLPELPRPEGTSWLKWLTSFPSYGYLLAVSENKSQEVRLEFEGQGITVADCGEFLQGHGIGLQSGGITKPVVF